ncbi:SDR family oxidoreductase [Chryseobacterium salviniae]|uniref:SDR family oxidoreductase n=1 Tax=Chryseobacterium salviniae TaxID=3101750 RepID=A0ABU6HUE4_9FLAO|nr:SDR family oxidoreductase [Chryseobacterium sp. T9W2-O]MEC3876038.1 SDR family oxidoreductase [Chryseobacterium sp. T9W2-O]
MKKIVFITGTNSGFGYLTAKRCAAEGYTVYATIRDAKTRNAERAQELSAIENINIVDLDVTDGAAVKNAISEIISKEGQLDVVVNNAGYFGGGLAEAYTEDDFEKMLNVHVKGPWRVIKSSLPQMRKQGEGLIINISSGLGRFSAPFMTVYNSAKFAIEGLSEGLHYEVRPFGVDVAIIQPGAFPTEIFGKSTYGSDTSIIPEYSDLAKIPDQIGEGMGKMFESMKPDPQMVPDAIVHLIKTPKGERPLRTVVDRMTGEYIETANKQVKIQYDNFVTAFGMQDVLK